MHDALLQWRGLGTPHAFETKHSHLTSALPDPVLRLRQVHGKEVHIIGADTVIDSYTAASVDDRPAGDALVTARPGISIAVATADCVPVLIHDPVGAVVGAAHAGWRGIAADVIGTTVNAMVERFDARPGRCRAAIGPCVGPSIYRVGSEVFNAFRATGLPEDLFRVAERDAQGNPSAWLCDLGRAAALQLRSCGLPDAAIWLANRCTFTEAERFHSYRRDGEAAGRMTSGIALA